MSSVPATIAVYFKAWSPLYINACHPSSARVHRKTLNLNPDSDMMIPSSCRRFHWQSSEAAGFGLAPQALAKFGLAIRGKLECSLTAIV